MKAIQIENTNPDPLIAIQNLKVVEKPIPKPGPGQVLIKIEAAPCNPSDLLFIQGLYGVKKAMPAVPGWEGAGTVVDCGPGVLGWWLKGKRVASAGQAAGDGTWAEYYVAEAKACVPLTDKVSFEQGATLIINPLTAVGMVETATAEGHQAIIQNAALSQVGRMVSALARKKGIPVVNIVRRADQEEELKSSGEKWIINSEAGDFEESLKKVAASLNATLAFDAVAGEMTGKILAAMPRGSKVLVYGALSKSPCKGISPLSLIFEKKKIEGFWLTEWIRKSGFIHIFQATRAVQKLIESGEFQTKIRKQTGFDGWKSELLDYQGAMTAGKVILNPFS